MPAPSPAPSDSFPSRRTLRTATALPSPSAFTGAVPTGAMPFVNPAASRVRPAAVATAPIPIIGPDRPPHTAPVAHRSPIAALRRPATAPVMTAPLTAGPVAAAIPSRYSATAADALRRKSHLRRVICTLAAVVSVPGLFATAALPAYSQTFETAPSFTSTLTGSQSIAVPVTAAAETISRSGISATTDEEMAERRLDNARASRAAAYNASGATAAGDDYPWPYEASDNEGGGLSPLGYYYRECVDFVAWRLNRDAGSTGGSWKYTWSYLTPNGGNASQWASNWRSHGWETGTDPVAGSVAWFNGNHVAYVKSVNGDGTVTIEEYNHGSSHKYGIRTIGVDDVALYLYAPPL